MWLNCGGRSNSCGISCWRWRSRKRPRYPRPGVANWSSVSGGRIGAANGIGSVRPVNEESRPKAGRHLSHFSPRPPLLRDFTKESMIFFLNCQTLWRRWGCHQKVWLPMLSSEPAPSSPRPWRSARRDPPGQFQTTKGEKRPELSVIFSNDPTIPSSVTPLNDLTGRRLAFADVGRLGRRDRRAAIQALDHLEERPITEDRSLLRTRTARSACRCGPAGKASWCWHWRCRG